MEKRARNTLSDTPHSREARLGAWEHSGFDDRLSVQRQLVYINLSTAIDDVSSKCVLNCRQPLCFRKLEADDKYEYVSQFLRVSFIQNSYRANLSLPKLSVLFIKDVAWVYVLAAAENDNELVNETGEVRDKTLYPDKGPPE